MLPDKIAFVDLETTGARSNFDRVIEVGILRVEKGKLVESFESLINPLTHLPPEIVRITGITEADLLPAPTFNEVKHTIQELLKDCVFVAHNVRFDYGFLRGEFKRENITFSSKHFCTVRLSRLLYPRYKKHNLDSLIERFNFECERRHRALDDAKVLFSFYSHAQTAFAKDVFLKAVQTALKKPSIPPHLSHIDIESIPESPGVYIFYGKDGAPLYVGKSKNVRYRVLSHFSGDLYSPIEMKISQQVGSIETVATAGELGALFLESTLIKRLLPLYNRRLRHASQLVVLKHKKDANGYETVWSATMQEEDINELYTAIQTEQNETSADAEGILGFFKSQKQAKNYLASIAKEFGLCERLLGIEKTKDACFGYRLDRCKGACIGAENQLFYNLRFTTATVKLKIKPWPFPGPIVIEEKNILTGITEHLIIDKWCHIGSILYDDGAEKVVERNYSFDLDAYKILKQYLYAQRNEKTIRPLSNSEQQSFSLSFVS